MPLTILSPGPLTTVQDEGRFGHLHAGIGRSGAMDARAYRAANALVGNARGEAVLEATLMGPTIRFEQACSIALTGADMSARLDGQPIPRYACVPVRAGQVLLALVCARIIRHVVTPLSRFAGAARQIAGGDFNVPLPQSKYKDEMGQLHDAFEYMQKALVEYMDRLRRTTAQKERIESELRIASDIQMGMIPKLFPPFPERKDIDLFAVLKPAKEVGGDLYDFFIH